MADIKVKMSTSYMLVFILSIVMVFVVLALSGATKTKGGGVGVFILGYTAWLIYKKQEYNILKGIAQQTKFLLKPELS